MNSRRTVRSRLMPKAMKEVHDELDSTNKRYQGIDDDDDEELTLGEASPEREKMMKTGVVWMKE